MRTGAEKVAVILTMLGEELAAAILQKLRPEEVRRIIGAMGRMQRLDPKVADQVLDEFRQELTKPGAALLQAGHSTAERMVRRAFGAGQVADDLVRAVAQEVPRLSALDDVEVDSLVVVLADERPQTVALVLAHLEPVKSAELIRQLNPNQRLDVLLKLANLGAVNPEMLTELNDWLQKELEAVGRRRSLQLGGAKRVAEILGHMDSSSQRQVFSNLRERDANVADEIEKLSFAFDDLVNLSLPHLQLLLRSVEIKILMVALRRCSESVAGKIFASMSERAATRLREDIAAMKPVRASDVEVAQQSIIAVAKSLSERGEIQLCADNEVYV